MNAGRLRPFYLLGIALNAIALVYAAMDGAVLFAVTFGVIMVYLGVRLWMLTTD